MKPRLLALIALLTAAPCVMQAQQTARRPAQNNQTPAQKKSTMPAWGQAHNYQNDKYVYFPDYYTFYSPDRGYVYWGNSRWTNSTSLPVNMTNTDMNTVRMQTLDVPLSTYPERTFSNYTDQYPAQPVNGITAPVPQVR